MPQSELVTMATELQRQTYESIMQIYDFADEAVNLAEKYAEISDPYIPYVEQIVQRVERNCDIMIDNFEKYLKSGKGLSGVEKLKIQKAKKEIDEAFDSFFRVIKN